MDLFEMNSPDWHWLRCTRSSNRRFCHRSKVLLHFVAVVAEGAYPDCGWVGWTRPSMLELICDGVAP